MSEVVGPWHPDVVADLRELPQAVQAAYIASRLRPDSHTPSRFRATSPCGHHGDVARGRGS